MLNLRMDTNINLRQRKDVHDININENNMRYFLCVLLEHRGSWITHREYTLGIHMHQHTDKGNLTGFICVGKFGSEIKLSNENSH